METCDRYTFIKYTNLSCISNGYFNMVNYKLSGIDGHMRIHSYLSDTIEIDKIYEYPNMLTDEECSEIIALAKPSQPIEKLPTSPVFLDLKFKF